MKLRSTQVFWPTKDHTKQKFPSLTTSASTPILIIGGGITGALIAYKLITEGKEVILVDKRDIGAGSTAASTALLQYEIDVPLHKLIGIRGKKCAVDSYKNCEKSIYDLQILVDTIKSKCGFELRKSIYFSSFKKDIPFLKTEYETRKKHGIDVKWLEKESLEKMGLNAWAAIESKSGAVLNPYKFAHDLIQYCHKKGMTVYSNTKINTIKKSGKKIKILTDENFEITADHVIHCTGYESVEMMPNKIVDLKSTYVTISESMTNLPSAFKNAIYWNTADPYMYFRGTSDGRIISGGGDEEFQNPEKRDRLIAKKEKYLVRQFRKHFPKIPFEPEFSWAGTFGETKDGLPYFGKSNPKINEHYVLGFGGNGIVFSVLGMDSILNSLNNLPHTDLEYYKFER